MTTLEEEIRRYKNGEMTPAEEHAFEKKALHDPLLAEALEGSELISEKEFKDDLEIIQNQIKNRAEDTDFKAVSSIEKRGNENIGVDGKRIWFWPLRIAASILLILSSYFFIDRFFLTDENTSHGELARTNEPIVHDSIAVDQGPLAAIEPKAKEGSIQPSAAKPESTVSRQKQTADSKSPDQSVEEKKMDLIVDEAELQAQPNLATEERTPQKITIQSQGASQAPASPSQQQVIKGKVLLAEDGTPLPGVNIMIKGTTIGTITDLYGNYQLNSAVPEPVLVYSFVGLQTQEVLAKGQDEINVQLQSDVSQLGEVVVTGYSLKNETPGYEPVIKLAQPVGGLKAYDRYLKSSLHYPQAALDNKIKGRVTVQFTVRTDGSLDEFNVLKGLGFGCDEEVIRLVKEGPKWNPTTEDDVPVESEVKVRVKFALPE